LDVYLKSLNDNTIHQFISLWGARAIQIGKSLGREDQIKMAFKRLDITSSNEQNSVSSIRTEDPPAFKFDISSEKKNRLSNLSYRMGTMRPAKPKSRSRASL
jgi:hypothetical protein